MDPPLGGLAKVILLAGGDDRSGALVTLASIDWREAGRGATILPRRAMPGVGDVGRDPASLEGDSDRTTLAGDAERGTVLGEEGRGGGDVARGMPEGIGDVGREGKRSEVLDRRMEPASLFNASFARRAVRARGETWSSMGEVTATVAGAALVVMPAIAAVLPVARRTTRGRARDFGGDDETESSRPGLATEGNALGEPSTLGDSTDSGSSITLGSSALGSSTTGSSTTLDSTVLGSSTTLGSSMT